MKDLQHGTGNRSVDLATSPRLKCKQLSMVQFLLEVTKVLDRTIHRKSIILQNFPEIE